MSEKALKAAMDFMENEKQFHLGFLPTEQSSPITRGLDEKFASSCEAGVRNLQEVDRNVLEMAKRIFASAEFKKLVDEGESVIRNGGKVVLVAVDTIHNLVSYGAYLWCCEYRLYRC